MKTILACCSTLFLAAAGLSANAGDENKYDLRGPAPEAGTVFRTIQKFEVKDGALAIDTQGKIIKGKTTITFHGEFNAKILAVEGRFVKKYQTKRIKEETKAIATIAGQTTTDDVVEDLAGTLVLSEKKGKEWVHSLVDAKPTEKQRKALTQEAGTGWHKDNEIPEGKLAVGHSWDAGATQMKKILGYQLAPSFWKGGCKATFVRVEKHRGELCAVIEQTGRIKAKYTDGDGSADIEFKATSYRSLRSGCDLTTNISGKYHELVSSKEGGVEVKTEVKGNFTASETNTITAAAK